MNSLTTNQGYRLLNDAEQRQLSQRVTTALPMSRSIGAALTTAMRDTAFTRSTPGEQATALRNFLSNERGTPDLVADHFTERTDIPAFSLSKPTALTNYPFRSGAGDAQQYTVNVSGRAIKVMAAGTHPAGTSQHTVDEVARAIASLPPATLAAVNTVTLEPNVNPSDAHWARVYGRPTFRSYMTAGATGDVHIYPAATPQAQSTLSGTLIHETGHTLSKRRFGEDSTKGAKWKDWGAAAASDGLHPSQYARSSNDEDFAETLQLYQQVRGTRQEADARRLFPSRFAIIDSVVNQS
jgi:hypothetical protein